MPAISLDGLLRLLEQAGDPAASANAALLYTKDVGGVTEVFARVSDGTVYQITPTLSLAAALPTSIEPDDAGAIGAAATAARADHQHAIVADVPGVIVPDSAPAEGVAASFSRADHQHGIIADVAATITDAVNTEGLSNAFSRADHQHAHGDRGGGTLHALFTAAAAGFIGAPVLAHPARALNTTFQPSATRFTLAIYSIRIVATQNIASGSQRARVELRSDAAAPPVDVLCRVAGGQTGTLVAALTIVDTVETILWGLVQPGHNVRLEVINEAGAPTTTLERVTEVTI